MGFRAKNEIIYSRVYGKTKREFERQMADSGYKNSSDFMEYLLRVNKGKQVDGVTLKEFTDVMKEVAHELKKQGVNISEQKQGRDLMTRKNKGKISIKWQSISTNIQTLQQQHPFGFMNGHTRIWKIRY